MRQFARVQVQVQEVRRDMCDLATYVTPPCGRRVQCILTSATIMPPIIEEFDDDTDLPLPPNVLPNTGTRGPLLEEITDFNQSQSAGSASQGFAPSPRAAFPSESSLPSNVVTDITPYKSCVAKWLALDLVTDRSADGRASIQFILMLNVGTESVLDELLVPKQSGGR